MKMELRLKRECMNRIKTLFIPKLKITLKILLKIKPRLNLKLKLKIVSTLELSLNVKNVMQILELTIALTTHSYIHNCKYLENTEYFDINSSQNMKEFYITDKAGKI